jgi:hypothetical protein
MLVWFAAPDADILRHFLCQSKNFGTGNMFVIVQIAGHVSKLLFFHQTPLSVLLTLLPRCAGLCSGYSKQ